MDEISLALNPPRFVKKRGKKRPIRLVRSEPVWPLPALNGRAPVIVEPTTRQPGIELAYERVAPSDVATECPPGTGLGTAQHFMPQYAAVLAMDGGVITFAGRLGNAYGMIIDHGNGWATHYRNLKSLSCIRTDLYSPREQHVYAGKTIGHVGAPAAGEFRRLYFELWRADRDKRFTPVDPRARLGDCKLVQHFDRFTPAPPEAQKEAA